MNLAVLMKVTSFSGKNGDSGNFFDSREPAGSVATPFQEFAQHLFRVACNTISGVRATLF